MQNKKKKSVLAKEVGVIIQNKNKKKKNIQK